MPELLVPLAHLFFSSQEASPDLDLAFLDACRKGRAEEVERLLKQGAQVNARAVLPQPENDEEAIPADWNEGREGRHSSWLRRPVRAKSSSSS